MLCWASSWRRVPNLLAQCAPASSLSHPGNIRNCLHWTAFSMVVFWVPLATLPLFAALSIVNLPLADFCRLVPRTGEDPSWLLEIFSVADQSLTDAFRGCVLTPNWSIINHSNFEADKENHVGIRYMKDIQTPSQTGHSEPDGHFPSQRAGLAGAAAAGRGSAT